MGALVDLFTLAEANGAVLQERFEGHLESASGDRARALRGFAELVEREGRIALNLRLAVLLDFLKHGKLLNVHEWAEEESRRTGRDSDRQTRDRLGRWYESRVGFEDRFVDGRRFHYGALNVGGLGPQRYGSCCGVFGEHFPGRAKTAFLESDSLVRFLDGHNQVKMTALEASIAAFGYHHYLAANKHVDECHRRPSESWPEMLCCDTDYVEAIFVGSEAPEDLHLVRFPHTDYREILRLALANLAGDPVTDADRLRISRFADLQNRLRALDVDLELVNGT